MQVRGLVHLCEAREGDLGGLELERRTEVELEHGRAAGVEARDSLVGFFVLQREVTGVVRNTEVRVDEALSRLLGAELFEETQRFRRVLGVADRLGLKRKAEMHASTVT